MKFKGEQKTFKYVQKNQGTIDEIFPLLCPVAEKDWIDGWNYTMIHSQSGLIEKDCVFSTPYNENVESVWQVTQYDQKKFKIEFVKVTPNENIVKINIVLKAIKSNQTESHITYQYTGLNADQNEYIKTKVEDAFNNSMKNWELSLNHYLKTGLQKYHINHVLNLSYMNLKI